MDSNLQKYMLKSGKSKAEISGVFKSAGQKRESAKLKDMSAKSDDHTGGDQLVKPPKKGSHDGEMTKVDSDGGSAVMKTPSEFGPADYKKGKKKPVYLED